MNGPLKDLLVLDLTRVLVGPYCTMILSDLGARVIKVEAPEIGDDSRKFGPFVKDYSAYFMSLNRGKESIALNLKKEDDKKIFEKILAKADVGDLTTPEKEELFPTNIIDIYPEISRYTESINGYSNNQYLEDLFKLLYVNDIFGSKCYFLIANEESRDPYGQQ